MRRYGLPNTSFECGDAFDLRDNAAKSSLGRNDGKGNNRHSKQKRTLRTIMNKRKRTKLKRELKQEIYNYD